MIKAVIFDLDGTLYLGKTPVPGAAEKVAELRKKGVKTLFLTNAATRSREDVALKLWNMGFSAQKNEVYCGAYAVARYVARNHAGKRAYVVGEKGMFDEFAAAGVPFGEDADLVAVGLDRDFTYAKLAKAYTNIAKGAAFLASNSDQTYPTENGHLPGAGAIVAAIQNATGKSPYVVGKPNPFAMELMMREHSLKKDEMLMVGDRLDTDVMFAKNCGIRCALVLTGTAGKKDIKKGMEPDYVYDSVAGLSLP
ncbi:MAG: HAD-IIA family hydrolase [Candidatus Micrarchaeota archaeon]